MCPRASHRNYWQLLGAGSREREEARPKGIPIGNLTSQIFANIYLNEFDRYVKHSLKPRAYLRYGDDFIIIADTVAELGCMRECAQTFLREKLYLELHQKNDILVPVKRGLKFLGVELFPRGRRLKRRNYKRVTKRVSMLNIASYAGLMKQHSTVKHRKEWYAGVLQKFASEYDGFFSCGYILKLYGTAFSHAGSNESRGKERR